MRNASSSQGKIRASMDGSSAQTPWIDRVVPLLRLVTVASGQAVPVVTGTSLIQRSSRGWP